MNPWRAQLKQSQFDAVVAECDSLRATLATQAATIEGLRKDAERYRWRRLHTKWNVSPEQFDAITDSQMNGPVLSDDAALKREGSV